MVRGLEVGVLSSVWYVLLSTVVEDIFETFYWASRLHL